MTWSVHLAFCFLSLLSSAHSNQKCSSINFNKYIKPKECSKDVFSIGSRLDEHEVYSKAECTSKCNNNDQCQSVNFEEKETYTCELTSDVPSATGYNMDTRKGFSYFQKNGPSQSDRCSKYKGCKHIKWLEFNVDTLAHRHNTRGFWGKDPLSPNATFYFMTYYENVKILYAHPTEQDYRSDTNRIQYNLPVGCDGHQGLVYGSKLYCNEHNQRNVMVFNIPDVNNYTRISFADVEGHQAGIRDQCRWHHYHYSDIDIATDEYGLWVIWGTYDNGCYLALSKINTVNQTIEKNYFFTNSLRKYDYGNAFMACGILYIINHHAHNPSYIRYTYNTHNDTLTSFELRGNAIMFPTKHGYNANTNYYHNEITGERFIAMWDSAHQIKITPIVYDP